MATIAFRVDDAMRSELEELAQSRGVSLSDLVRSTLEGLILRDDPRGRWTETAPRTLTTYERQMLAMQHRILAHVMPPTHEDAPTEDCAHVEGDPDYQRQRAQILEGGYVTEYSDVFISTHPELTADECTFVMDLLDMFRTITVSIQRLRGAGQSIDSETERLLQFDGFDYQVKAETRFLDYVRHLVSETRWSEVLPVLGPDHDYGNSHGPRLELYQRILGEYQLIRHEQRPRLELSDYLLTADQLQRLADAGTHPSRRSDPQSGGAAGSPSTVEG